MKVIKVKYNNGANEGYYIKTRKGYVQVTIKSGEAVKLRNISDEKEVRLSEVTLKLEEVSGNGSYFN